jgi:predicted small lipoprotein YifL
LVHRPVDRLRLIALAAVLVAAGLAVAACGRKGPLDAPPSAALTPPAAARPSLGEESDNPASTQSGATVPARTQASAPAAPPPRKTSFFLDFVLGR